MSENVKLSGEATTRERVVGALLQLCYDDRGMLRKFKIGTPKHQKHIDYVADCIMSTIPATPKAEEYCECEEPYVTKFWKADATCEMGCGQCGKPIKPPKVEPIYKSPEQLENAGYKSPRAEEKCQCSFGFGKVGICIHCGKPDGTGNIGDAYGFVKEPIKPPQSEGVREAVAKIICKKYHGLGDPCVNCFISADQILALLQPAPMMTEEEIEKICRNALSEFTDIVLMPTLDTKDKIIKNQAEIRLNHISRKLAHALSGKIPAPVQKCVCGQPETLGVVHMKEGPCFVYEKSAPEKAKIAPLPHLDYEAFYNDEIRTLYDRVAKLITAFNKEKGR